MHTQFTDETAVCTQFMQALELCHEDFWKKFTGGCNETKHALNMCLRQERLERSAKNRETAKVRSEKIKKGLEDLHEYD